MADPIRFWFDFASPYGYFASTQIEDLARRHGREVEWKPVMVWALLKAHGIAPPGQSPRKWDYFVRDMRRSADYFGLPYVHPARLPFSAHRAARLFHVVAVRDRDRAVALAKAILRALFVEARDIADPAVLGEVAAGHGLDSQEVAEAIEGDEGRRLLAEAIEEAVAAGVCGSPFFEVDGEPFFGVDRLPQIDWWLSREGSSGMSTGAT